MQDKIDVAVAYLSIVLLLLSPSYYVLCLLSRLVRLSPNSVILLILAILIDSVLVKKMFKIHYN